MQRERAILAENAGQNYARFYVRDVTAQGSPASVTARPAAGQA
jgi:hypothetical protein